MPVGNDPALNSLDASSGGCLDVTDCAVCTVLMEVLSNPVLLSIGVMDSRQAHIEAGEVNETGSDRRSFNDA